MSKPELGTKRDCPSCSAKFYDLGKSPAICPKCKNEFVPDAGVKAKRTKPVEKPKEKASPARPSPRVVPDEDGNVSLDAMRDEELASEEIDDEDLLGSIGEDIEDDDADDAFLPDEDDENDDVSDIVRGHGGDDE